MTNIPDLDNWIPIRLYWNGLRPMVDWCYLGQSRFSHPFFSQTIESCLRKPFNLLFRHQTPIELLGQRNEIRTGLAPSGFIFHMSRCGSTLIAQMLAASSRSIVISEAAPIDLTLRANLRHPGGVTDDQRATWFRWLVSALAQPRNREEFCFIKFDAWNVMDLPVIRKAFPDVPWIFIYRDPVEVMVSQFGRRGAHMIPGAIAPKLFGTTIDEAVSMSPEEYCARVLATICESALRYHAGGGMLINYKQLPEVVLTSLSNYMGLDWTATEREKMKNVRRLHAKNPSTDFRPDSAGKQDNATREIRDAAQKWLYPVYERLEIARQAQETNPQITQIGTSNTVPK